MKLEVDGGTFDPAALARASRLASPQLASPRLAPTRSPYLYCREKWDTPEKRLLYRALSLFLYFTLRRPRKAAIAVSLSLPFSPFLSLSRAPTRMCARASLDTGPFSADFTFCLSHEKSLARVRRRVANIVFDRTRTAELPGVNWGLGRFARRSGDSCTPARALTRFLPREIYSAENRAE